MRRYETTYILRPNLGESQFTEIIERTNDIIKNDGGAIIHLEQWGSKKLAYEIKKETLGYYIYFDYAAPGTTVHEMERIFRIDDRVLRYLTVKLEDSIDQETIAKETELAIASEAAKSESEETDVKEEENDHKKENDHEESIDLDESDSEEDSETKEQ